MVKISIICLIYRSTKLADWVYESAYKYTPKLQTGEADFLFVANDPEDYVVRHLVDKGYPFIINRNPHYTEDELFERGFGIPEHMNRVYKGYNQGILHAKGERIVLINSDNFFSPDWLENLLKYSEFKNVVTSQLVERRHPKFSVFPGALEQNFGSTVDDFLEDEFIQFTYKVRKTGLKPDGAYMPALLYRDVALYAGLYPEGNIAGKTKDQVVRYGDEDFYARLKSMGVEHYTALDSIVYHLKEGEREEKGACNAASLQDINTAEFEVLPYGSLAVEKYDDLNVTLEPSSTHQDVLCGLKSDNQLPSQEYGVLLAQTQEQLRDAQRILSHPLIRAQRKLWRMLRFWK